MTYRAMNRRATLEVSPSPRAQPSRSPPSFLQASYISIMESMLKRFPPELVSYDTFTFPRFLFSYNTIQVLPLDRMCLLMNPPIGSSLRSSVAVDSNGSLRRLSEPL
jgi:hypothetical protein